MKRRLGWVALAAAVAWSPAAAQDTVSAPRTGTAPAPVAADSPSAQWTPAITASPPLAEDHWAVRAAWRAEAMGLTRFLPAQRNPNRAAVARALADAAAHARTAGERRLTAGWLARWYEEFPEYRPRRADEPVPGSAAAFLRGSAATAGYQHDAGQLAPAIGYSNAEQRRDPRALGTLDDGYASLRIAAGVPWLSVEAEPAYRAGAVVLRSGDAAVGFGAFQLSAGREPVGYGYGRTGGIVLSDPEPFTRGELETARPVRLPWLFRALGPATLHLFGGAVNDPARHATDPYLWGMRVAIQPHPRVTLAVNRASIFGGDSARVTATNLLKMLIGQVHSSTFENQVVSGEVRYRLPTDRIVPATAYLEWGADDAAGAIQSEPGRVIGVFFPALPGAPQAGAGAEYTFFKHACCEHGPWYFNFSFPGNWALHDQPLGHPLGGEGAEYAVYGNADLLDARLRIDARAFIADRSVASLLTYGGGNLFAPEHAGRSHGGWLKGELRLGPRLEATALASLEQGSGWREEHGQLLLSWLF